MASKLEEMLKKIKTLEKETAFMEKDAAAAKEILKESAKTKSLIKKAVAEAKSVED